jgi:hypothetical protein
MQVYLIPLIPVSRIIASKANHNASVSNISTNQYKNECKSITQYICRTQNELLLFKGSTYRNSTLTRPAKITTEIGVQKSTYRHRDYQSLEIQL